MLTIYILFVSLLSNVVHSRTTPRLIPRQFSNITNSTVPAPVKGGINGTLPGNLTNTNGTVPVVTINLFANSYNNSGKQVQHAIDIPADGLFRCLSDLQCSNVDAKGASSPTNPSTGPDSFCAVDKTAAVSVGQDVSSCVVYAPTSDRNILKITRPGQKFFFGRYAPIVSACCGNCQLNKATSLKLAINGTNSCAPKPKSQVVRLR